MSHIIDLPFEHRYGKIFQGFHELMRYRIRDIILVSSLYDLYVFEEDGRLYELIREEYRGLNLSHAPELTRVSSGKEALDLAKDEKRFDLIITTPHIEDMEVSRFAKLVRNADLKIPLVLLTYDSRDTSEYLTHYASALFDRVFIWQGDFRILIGIIKHIEDSLNVEHDTSMVGVQVFILIEDNVRFYSSYLPIIYMELFKQSMRLISEGVNLSDRYLRMRARPKILLCTNYEDAWYYFEKYRDSILGIISDIDFMRDGLQDPQAGIEFARNVHKLHHDIPILLQSNLPENNARANEVGASFLLKESPTLLNDLRKFMTDNFGFGDFIFRTEDRKDVARANDLFTLEQSLKTVPAESIKYHADRNHFSNWLKARTEFWLAYKLRPRKVSEFSSIEDLRQLLISSLRDYRKARQRGTITDFRKKTFDPSGSFARIGGGSLGGKARGISFVNLLINNSDLRHKFKDIIIRVPPAVVLGTDIFDYFIDENDLRHFALSATDDAEIARRFLAGDKFPEDIVNQLRDFQNIMRDPLAVRSSSLLEDSQYHPFAGVYDTYMIPNNNENPEVRLQELLNTIKCVYASTFYKHAKDYIQVTSYRLEEEKMAVIIQKMVGGRHKNRFYPDFAGVAKSHNFYPVSPQKASDGIISVALGLGKTVVEGGEAVRFCSKYPNHIPQFSSINDTLKNSQQTFYALDLEEKLDANLESYEGLVKSYPLDIAESDGSLYNVGSTYSHDNHAIYDGLSRKGTRLVTFAPILKNKIFPFPQILELLLEMGRKGMGTPIEIEFAVNMTAVPGTQKEFGVLQMRPLVLSREMDQLKIEKVDNSKLLCKSNQVLGNGLINNIHDVIVVDYENYERSRSRDVAREVYYFNARLLSQKRHYILIGVGRWGSLDPWLGIPVRWEQISGAKAIVETSFKDLCVTPSQGSHFFQNITSFMIGYFTVNSYDEECFVDWKWLREQPGVEELEFTRHIRFEEPLTIKMNGHKQKGIIFKPEE
jgi:CheY-like chemotaxis protein